MSRVVRPLASLVAGGLIALAAAPARGHVVPSVDANNRYLKVSPMGDRVRLAYTVLFGEQPGAVMRRRLDRDRDGAISDAEADVLGRELSASLAPALTIAVDGQPVRWSWAKVSVGLGTPTAIGGSLSVDLIAWICTPGGDAHRLAIRDEYQLELAGASELLVEEGPGVHLGDRTLGGDPLPGTEASWNGKGGPITAGFELHYRVDADATRPKDGRCASARTAGRRPRWPVPFLACAVVALVIAVAVRARRRRQLRT